MSPQADVDLLSDLYHLLQDLMEQHQIVDEALKDLYLREDDQDFSPIENASTLIINTCEKIEDRLSCKKCPSCCHS